MLEVAKHSLDETWSATLVSTIWIGSLTALFTINVYRFRM